MTETDTKYARLRLTLDDEVEQFASRVSLCVGSGAPVVPSLPAPDTLHRQGLVAHDHARRHVVVQREPLRANGKVNKDYVLIIIMQKVS